MNQALARRTTERLDPLAEFAADVQAGLLRKGQKQLPPKYFYDAVGSALFEAITALPEYGLTRADERVLGQNAGAIAGAAGRTGLVIELEADRAERPERCWPRCGALDCATAPSTYPLTALAQCTRELDAFANVLPVESGFLEGLTESLRWRRTGERALVLFLGSTIGNFLQTEAVEFLRGVHARLQPGDALLIGADLVKPVETLRLAYDDPIGVTAAFNLNVLARINRELGGEFRLECFRHRVLWDEAEHRIEMHLESLRRQSVRIAACDGSIRFARGETIWTESSHKYTVGRLEALAETAGFAVRENWTDREWGFVESLWVPE